LSEVFGRHAIFGFGVGGFYEQAAELLEGFGVVNHLSGVIYDGSQSPTSRRQLLSGVLGVFMPQSASSSFAEWLGFNVAEI
jgi:hypothetical protein